MKTHTSPHGYPVFSQPEGIEHWPPTNWLEMIGGIPAPYFRRTGRVPVDCAPVSVLPLDCAVFREEGDEFVLSLVELELASGDRLTLFLPLMRTILPTSDEIHHTEISRKLAQDRGLVAFGIETQSDFFGKRPWVVYDAFLDEEFLSSLLGLLWPGESFFALQVSQGEHGTFGFRVDPASAPPHHSTPRLSTDDEGNLSVVCTECTLSLRANVAQSESESGTPRIVLGSITYEGHSGPSLTIGVLHRTGS